MAQRSILNYFEKKGSSENKSSPSNKTPDLVNKDKSKGSNRSSSASSSNTHNKNSKRPPSADTTPTNNKQKRPRTEETFLKDPSLSPKDKEFHAGSLVWAMVEGYPFWPAMIRGEKKDGIYFRESKYEYHVQFFDTPPSRAWIRISDIKKFKSSTDGQVPPVKYDPKWIDGCKMADNALKLSTKQRLEKYWIDFDDIKIEDEEEKEEKSPNPKRKLFPSKKTPLESSDDEEDVTSKTKKKRTLRVIDDDEEDEEYKPNIKDEPSSPESDNSGSPETELSSPEQKSINKSKENGKKSIERNKANEDTPVSIPTSAKRAELMAKFSASAEQGQSASSPRTPTSSAVGKENEKPWPHLSFSWLKEDKIMDAKRRRPDNPDYDHKTLYIPKDFLEKLTPAVHQWWILKSEHFDTILFFKVGKFYELYHMDAVIAVNELGLTFMRGEFAHCGFPEIAYSHNANSLVAKGYKVARCEQTETPAMMTERVSKTSRPTKFDKVVNREICQVTTKGIRLASAQDERSMPFHPRSEYLYAIVERNDEYGVCFIDTTIGQFFIGQFKDDRHFSRLRTLFSHHIPCEILYEKGKLSAGCLSLLNNLSTVRKDPLIPDKEFWNSSKTLKFLAEGEYFISEETKNFEWPENFRTFLSKSDTLGLTPSANWELGIMSLGAVIWFLKQSLVEHDILTLRSFQTYFPVDLLLNSQEGRSSQEKKDLRFMVLDGITLRNLEITEGPKSLLSILDKCSTPFGKRQLRNWTCVPLANPDEIKERQDAITELMQNAELADKVSGQMRGLLDLERLLRKIHSLGSSHRSHSGSHPDSRASMYDEKQYSKRKIVDLTNVLKNFKTCVTIINNIKGNSDMKLESSLLAKIIGDFPSLDKLLNFFDIAFDHESAIKDGKIIPAKGVDNDYDAAFEQVEKIQREAEVYLKKVQMDLQTKVTFFGSDKKRFQLEMSEKVKVSREYEISSTRKGFKRYITPKTKEILAQITEAEVNRENIVKDITRRVFAQFDKSRSVWNEAVSCLSTLDVLLSLSKYSRTGESMCRPSVVLPPPIPFIHVVDGRHPALSSDTYIPNSCELGGEGGSFLLLTGANMGGKSTAMKQTGLLALLAHMGCYVPATSCEMSVIDRIFTRIGANDNIGEGESTFFVELSETSSILQHSTSDSLILMDELGRGTATHDGNALAFAVGLELSQRGSRTIFSTHYFSLVASLSEKANVQIGHMACMVERESEDDDDPTRETITFLYKLMPGACPKSYGFNAARLAGIPDKIIRSAHHKAKELEASNAKIKNCTRLLRLISLNKITKADTRLLST